MSEPEIQLQKQLEQERETSRQLQQQLSQIKIQNQIELEKQKQSQWAAALEQIKEIQEESLKQQEKNLGSVGALLKQALTKTGNPPDLTSLLQELLTHKPETDQERNRGKPRKQEKKEQKQLAERLVAQQKDLMQQAEALHAKGLDQETKNLLETLLPHNHPPPTSQQPEDTMQQQLLTQLRPALGHKEQEDPQKAILKQFLTKSNTTPTGAGATTLKPHLLKQLTGEEEDFNMAEWLAMFNKQDQGESPINIDDDPKNRSSRSGILDKATSNIQHKETWPQKNLMETGPTRRYPSTNYNSSTLWQEKPGP